MENRNALKNLIGKPMAIMEEDIRMDLAEVEIQLAEGISREHS